jgi:predicted  nucleic acid-binding Zn-ribbon protein
MNKAKTYAPGALTALADSLHKAEANYHKLRRQMEAKLEPLKKLRNDLEEQLLVSMLEVEMESVSTKLATISIKRNTFAEMYDDAAFFEFVGKNKAWDLVRKQPVVSACRERWDDDVKIPGVRPGTKMELSITTRTKK